MSNIITMSVKEEHICRLCLKVAKDEFGIDENIKQMFEILSLKLDLDITRIPIICHDCMEVSIKCLNFKYTCINTEEIILSYSVDRKKAKLDIKVIYEERERVWPIFDEGFNICRLCMTRLEIINFTSLEALMNESMFEKLSEYMAETDFNSIENPLVCASCKENLEGYFKFVLSCQDIEEKIKAYCKGTDNMGQVKLSNVLLFMFTEVLEYPDKCCQTSKIEQDGKVCVYPKSFIGSIKQEEVQIKDEEMILDEPSYRNTSEIKLGENGDTSPSMEYDTEIKFDLNCLNSGEHNTEWLTHQKNVQANMENSLFDVLEMKRNEIHDTRINKRSKCTDGTKQNKRFKSNLTNDSDALEADVFEHKLYTSKAKQRRVLKKHASTCKVASGPKQKHKITKRMLIRKGKSVPQNNISVDKNVYSVYNCSLCTYEAKRKNYLTKHMLVHKDVSEINMHKCSLCPYEAKQKTILKRHMLVHKDVSEIKMYNCSFCAYESKQKRYLKTHMLVHKDVSEINMHKCSLCPYEAKQKTILKRHMLVHKDVSEIKTHKCSLCAYESKYKSYLKTHMLVHKDVSEIKMYKCLLCAYEAKKKGTLKTHMLIHKDVSEINMHKCSLCPYEAKQKTILKRHMLVHKDVSEIKMHKCSLCAYESKYKSYLKTHMLVHKDVSEIKMYKCLLCAYEAKKKGTLKTHMLIHKDASEIKMYKCSLCVYKTKHKSDLNKHMLVHKDISNIKMYKCSLCSYEAKYKSSLKQHMLGHKDVSDIKMFKCSLCAYEAKRKSSLTTHMVVHKDISEIKMFKCLLCAYEAKLKSHLKTHMIVHKDVSEIKIYKCSLCTYKAKRKSYLKKHMLDHKRKLEK